MAKAKAKMISVDEEGYIKVETSGTGYFTYLTVGKDGYCMSRKDVEKLIVALLEVREANNLIEAEHEATKDAA
jgi:hypothetical protein